MERGELFKKALGIRTLIKSSVDLDQPINHYIAYDRKTDLFEITIFAQAQERMMPFWTVKIDVDFKYVKRLLLYIFKLIDRYDKMLLSQAKIHRPPGSEGGSNGTIQRPK